MDLKSVPRTKVRGLLTTRPIFPQRYQPTHNRANLRTTLSIERLNVMSRNSELCELGVRVTMDCAFAQFFVSEKGSARMGEGLGVGNLQPEPMRGSVPADPRRYGEKCFAMPTPLSIPGPDNALRKARDRQRQG
jgi:hypothetical protein